MEDSIIVDLYFQRAERAITETSAKYGNYCSKIANNILNNMSDAEECVNDTYLRAWNAIPPHRPTVLSAFLGKITRNLSLDKCKARYADKRADGELALALDELDGCVPSCWSIEQQVDYTQAAKEISNFLRCQPSDRRQVFVRRYWYMDSISDIANHFGMSESKVKSMLFRMRSHLKAYLESEGITI